MSRKIPPLPITGVGSLPKGFSRQAMEDVFSLDIPYLPTFPQMGGAETFLGQLEIQEDAAPGVWSRLEAWKPWLERVAALSPPVVKWQWPGAIAMAQALTHAGRRGEYPAFARRWKENIQSILEALADLPSDLCFFFDEPGLGNPIEDAELEKASWWTMEEGFRLLKERGVAGGIHCCGSVPWFGIGIRPLPVQILQWDWEREGRHLKDFTTEVKNWFQGDRTFGLGVVPTRLPEDWNPAAVVEEVLEVFSAIFGPEKSAEILARCWLSPACGLGTRSVEDATAVFSALRQLRQALCRSLHLK